MNKKTEINKFDLENFALPRISDWGFKVIYYDEEGIEVKPLYEMYGIIETLKDICLQSGIEIKSYYLKKNGNIKLCYRYKHELRDMGVI